MADDTRSPVVVAFDGSPESEAAMRAAAELFGSHPLVVVSVWEPGLAVAMAPLRDPAGIGYAPPSFEEIEAIDRAQHDHALEAVELGARLARELGAEAETYPVADEADIPDTIAAIAARRQACAVVVGSRGLGAVKSKLFGSTSRELLQRLDCPVLVVKAPR